MPKQKIEKVQPSFFITKMSQDTIKHEAIELKEMDLDYVKSLEMQIVELQTQVNELQAQKDKRTMLKMRQFGTLAEGLTQYRNHLKLLDVIMYKWYDAYMNGDMDALICELLNDRRGYCHIKDCRDCDKGIALECACQADWE